MLIFHYYMPPYYLMELYNSFLNKKKKRTTTFQICSSHTDRHQLVQHRIDKGLSSLWNLRVTAGSPAGAICSAGQSEITLARPCDHEVVRINTPCTTLLKQVFCADNILTVFFKKQLSNFGYGLSATFSFWMHDVQAWYMIRNP